MRIRSGTFMVIGIVVAAVLLAVAAWLIRPPVPSMRRPATQPGDASPRPSYTPFP